MKVAVAQINTTIGDFQGNTSKILDRIEWAKANGVDIVVFPEMAISGYPPKDLLDRTYFIKKNMESLRQIVKKTDEHIAVVVGTVSINEAATGRGLFNSAVFLYDAKINHIQNKTLLPTYDVFDEARYFEYAKEHETIEFKGKKIGLTICEDIWSSAELGGRKLYNVDPVDMLVAKDADFIINISASPYVLEKRELRKKLLGNIARAHALPIVYVNLVGANDELIFDGRSMVVDKNGDICREGGAFVEDAFIVDIDNLEKGKMLAQISEAEEVYEALVLGLRDYVQKCGFERVVVGLSGGVDSALVATIAADAIGAKNVLGIAMPTRFSSKASLTDARQLVMNLGITFKVIEIDETYQHYVNLLSPEFEGRAEDTTEENLQARIRGNILMAFSNKFGALVLSTGNKSEMAVGYCTLYGDMAGGLAVIADVPKTMVYNLCNYINRDIEIIPSSILNKKPSAELKPNQTDQDTLPEYDVLDGILKAYVEERLSVGAITKMGFEGELVEDIAGMVDRSEYKRRQAPPVLKVTSKAFGAGRRCPIACKS